MALGLSNKMGWKLYFVFYVSLVSSEIGIDNIGGAGTLLCILKTTFSVAFAFPLLCFAFDKTLVSKKLAGIIFYISAFWWVYVLAGTGNSMNSLIMAAFIIVLYAPGFVAINHYRRVSNA
ncbi:hypothetical protein [Zhongshania sp. BJYM1]|uniref:hypothetical protein n=1 Tax=Zhongshania aquatica TaxID=2965069 RepID=UPI0022B4AF71|nr:hypothetical protein [Marortus sp. BJYM1]